MTRFRYIFIAVAASIFISVLSSCRDSGVIDEKVMAQIYAEMLMTDQWINSNPEARKMADTTLVYEPILKKYGYTSEDYRYSISYYLEHHKEFVEITKQTVKILEQKREELEKEKVRIDNARKAQAYKQKISEYVDLDETMIGVNANQPSEYDPDASLTVKWDTLSLCFSIGIEVPSDSLTVSDSLSVTDTLAVPDTLRHMKFWQSDRILPLKDTLRKASDTTAKTIHKIKNMRPLRNDRRIGNAELHKVKDAYLLKD